jgi:hypothetical protein
MILNPSAMNLILHLSGVFTGGNLMFI